MKIGDIGSGAGFPGLALAAALPSAQVDLIESVGRKCDFMGRAIAAAGVANAQSPQHPLRGTGGHRCSRELRRRQRTGRRPPLDPRRAGFSPPKRRGRLGRLEGQARRARRPNSREPPSRWRCDRKQILDVGDRAGSQHRHLHVIRKSGPTPPTSPDVPASPRSAPRAESRAARGGRVSRNAPRGDRASPEKLSAGVPSCGVLLLLSSAVVVVVSLPRPRRPLGGSDRDRNQLLDRELLPDRPDVGRDPVEDQAGGKLSTKGTKISGSTNIIVRWLLSAVTDMK